MILETQEIVKRETLVGDTEGFDMQLSVEDMTYIMTLLSDLYKDPYSIIPQELLSNSWDSHVEAKCQKEPIICEIKKDINDKWYFAAQDFGVGISPERIKIFGAYGKSTKRTTNDFIGGFGLGCKSPMCYTKTFYVETVYDGIKYIYYIAPNPEGIPRIDLLGSENSDLSNRSKVWFYLKKDVHSYPYDYKTEAQKFLEGVKRKTIYFDNLVYDFDPSLHNLNDYKRVEGKHFVFSEARPFTNLHILLGQVPYELDFQLLGLPTISVPIAVKIESGVIPTPTREALKYSDKSIEIIKEAIIKASTELVELCNKKRVDITNWKEWLDKRNDSPTVMLGNQYVTILQLVNYSTTPLQNIVFTPLKDIDTSNINADTIFPFKCTSKINNGRRGDYRDARSYGRQNRFSTGQCMRIIGNFTSKKNGYLFNELDYDLVYVFRKQKLKLLDYKKLLNLKWKDRTEWRSKITQYQKFVNEVWDNIESYDDLVVPKEYLQKFKSKVNKPGGVVVIYNLEHKDISDYINPAVGRKQYVKEFEDKKLVIYGTQEELRDLEQIWKIAPISQCKVMYLAQSNHKYLESHQYVNMKDWHKTKMFSRIITAWKIKELLKKYSTITNHHDDSYSKYHHHSKTLLQLSTTYSDLLHELYAYKEKNLRKNEGNRYGNNYRYDDKFMEELVKVADTQKLWDYSVYYKIARLEEYLKKFEWVTIFKPESDWTPFAANYIKKVTKDVRLDLKFYQNEPR